MGGTWPGSDGRLFMRKANQLMRFMRCCLSISSGIVAGLFGATVCLAENPIIQTKFTADPDPVVHDGTVYLFTSHDEDDAQGYAFKMKNWLLYTTTDMVNWTDHGPIAGTEEPYNTFPWVDHTNSAWAPKAITRNGKWYLYGCFQYKGHFAIGVAVADSPFGPYVDVLGKPLIYGNSDQNDYDPAPFVDDDGQAYLYWGGGNPNNKGCYYVKLNEDMISTSGKVVDVTSQLDTYQEGPEIWKHNGNYYLGWATICCPEGIGYAMSDKPTGPWKSMGYVMRPSNNSSGNSCGYMDYEGKSYVFGFSYELLNLTTTQHHERRSVNVTTVTYNADGSIQEVPWWGKGAPTPGVAQLGHLNPYVTTQAETIAWALSVKTEPCAEGGLDVTAIENGDFIKVAGVDFAEGATALDVRVASAGSGGSIEVRLDSKTGKVVGTCAVAGTGGVQKWVTKTCPITGASGAHDLYFVFTGGTGSNLFNFNWWKFYGSSPIDGGALDAAPLGAGGAAAGGTGGGRSGGGGTGVGGVGGGGRDGAEAGSSGTGFGGAQTGNGGSGNGGAGGAASDAGGQAGHGGVRAGSGTTGAGGAKSTGTSTSSTGGGSGGIAGGSGGVAGAGGGHDGPSGKGSSSGCSCRVERASGNVGVMVGLFWLTVVGLRRRTRV
jgi:arabinoxylan arabinofuranohydrolase